MIGTRRTREGTPARGLGRLVEPDSHLLTPTLRPWSKALVVDDRTVSVSWARGAAQRLHSVVVEYRPDAVLIGTRMGSRPSTSARPPGHVALRMVLEHAVVRLREPLRGRRIEVMTAEPTRRQAQTSAR